MGLAGGARPRGFERSKTVCDAIAGRRICPRRGRYRRHCAAKFIDRVDVATEQILLILIAVRQLAWIALRLAQSILEFRWVDCVARRILQLVVDVLIVRSGIAHRANRLAYANQITPPHLLGLSMQDFVRKSIGIPYGYSANTAFPGVCHDAGHRRPQFRIASIKPRVLAADIIEIDASMRNARAGFLLCSAPAP